MRLFLISNSTLHGQGYLDHCLPALREFLGPAVQRILFVPYALHERGVYSARFRERMGRAGYTVDGLEAAPDPRAAVAGAQAVFIGGGNTFRLLGELYRQELLAPLRARVVAGMPYMGSSAGTNVACRSIQTTNDMPIVHPPSLEALGLVPFNVNPHYVDPDPGSTHMGETREQRIREFHEEESAPVVGLREGAWLRRAGASLRLEGTNGARLFRRGQPAAELASGAELDYLLGARS